MSVEKLPVLYLNITINDGSEAVKAKVARKVEQSKLPRPMKKVAAKHAGQAASDFATPKILAGKIGQKICRLLPKKMKEKGVTVEMEEVFREANYVVLQLQVIRVDTVAAAEAKSKKDGNETSVLSEWIEWFLQLIGAGYQEFIEGDYLPNMVTKQLASEMPKILKEKLIKKKVKAETKVLKEKNQARYFYAKLRDIRAEEEVRREKNPIHVIRKRMSSNTSTTTDVGTDSSSNDEA